MLPKVRIPSIRCTPIVKHEKTRRELAQLTDLESTLLDKVLISFGFYLALWFSQINIISAKVYITNMNTSQFNFCISIFKQMLRCVITVVLPAMTANIQQKIC